mgnify:CR=1 FL=1
MNKLFELVMLICMQIEKSEPDLIVQTRASWNPEHGSIDNHLAKSLLKQIRLILPALDESLKRNAYNEIADNEDLLRIEQDETDFDYLIVDAFLDPVITEIVEPRGEEIRPTIH